ncbi:MAG: diguanylate cyclase domain-containing protein [Jatrophihabitantaceae bacterium]
MRAPIPDNEEARVAALLRLGIVDQPRTPDLDALSRLAAYVTGAPFGAINLIDADRQWQAAVAGGQPGSYDRADSLCQHTVYEGRTIHVADAGKDPRFSDSPFVTGEIDRIALYCGVPLRDSEGFVLGTLCITDSRARQLSDAQIGALEDLAEQVERLFEMRRQHAQLLDVLTELDHRAVHDPLTGLVNRRVLAERLELALERTRRGGLAPVVFFCDLDGFKAVNDRLGHQAGDEVLIEVARRLRASIRPTDTAARVGGDELVVLCEDLPAEHRAAVAERIRSATAESIATGAGSTRVGLSVGMAVATPGRSAADILEEADRGMYLDKLARRSPA